VPDDGVQQGALSGAGFAADQQVAEDQRQVDRVAELVDAEEHGVEDGHQRADRDARPDAQR
jgi:hypothetical protein